MNCPPCAWRGKKLQSCQEKIRKQDKCTQYTQAKQVVIPRNRFWRLFADENWQWAPSHSCNESALNSVTQPTLCHSWAISFVWGMSAQFIINRLNLIFHYIDKLYASTLKKTSSVAHVHAFTFLIFAIKKKGWSELLDYE